MTAKECKDMSRGLDALTGFVMLRHDASSSGLTLKCTEAVDPQLSDIFAVGRVEKACIGILAQASATSEPVYIREDLFPASLQTSESCAPVVCRGTLKPHITL